MKHTKLLRSLIVAVLFILVSLTVTSNSYASNSRANVEKTYSAYWHKAKNVLGERAPGRNIRKWGVENPSGKTRKASIQELKESTIVLQNMTTPKRVATATYSNSSVSTSAPSTSYSSSGGQYSSSELSSIAQCESGGNPSAVSSDGQYHGLYQISEETWKNYNGNGTAAGASVAEQNAVASRLPRSSWPNC